MTIYEFVFITGDINCRTTYEYDFILNDKYKCTEMKINYLSTIQISFYDVVLKIRLLIQMDDICYNYVM